MLWVSNYFVCCKSGAEDYFQGVVFWYLKNNQPGIFQKTQFLPDGMLIKGDVNFA